MHLWHQLIRGSRRLDHPVDDVGNTRRVEEQEEACLLARVDSALVEALDPIQEEHLEPDIAAGEVADVAEDQERDVFCNFSKAAISSSGRVLSKADPMLDADPCSTKIGPCNKGSRRMAKKSVSPLAC